MENVICLNYTRGDFRPEIDLPFLTLPFTQSVTYHVSSESFSNQEIDPTTTFFHLFPFDYKSRDNLKHEWSIKNKFGPD